MTKMKILLAALVLTAACAVVPNATAQCPFNYSDPSSTPLPCVHYMSAGSSAMYQGFGVSVVDEIAPALIANTTFPSGSTISVHHFTTKGGCTTNCTTGGNQVGLVDGRDSHILEEQVTYWVAWINCTGGACGAAPGVDTDVWAYNQVDSTVGNRTFLAQGPKVVSAVASGANATNMTSGDGPTNNIDSRLLISGDTGTAGGGCNAASLSTCDAPWIPVDVYGVVNNHPITTGMTDIRAEDALFATARSNCNANGAPVGPWNCLGYQPNTNISGGDVHVALPIKSAYTTSAANPVDFGLPGTKDPITGVAVPTTIISIPVGEDPIVFFANRTDSSGLGYQSSGTYAYNNLSDNTGGLIGSAHGYPGGPGGTNWLGYMFAGNDCAGDNAVFGAGSSIIGKTGPSANFAIHLMQREALSGTMNTTEFSAFDIYGGSLGTVDGSSVGNSTLVPWTSQEANINPQSGDDPLAKNCSAAADGTTGDRHRVIGAGEMEKGSKCPGGSGGVCNVEDSLGYNFWSFGNFSSVASSSYGYLQVDGVDPLYATYSNGAIPSCTPKSNCDINNAFGGKPFPHLVDGTYRTWSLLRAYCDTAYTDPITGGEHCTAAEDPYGTEGLIAYAQSDIGNAAADSVADYLPFQDAEVGKLAGTTAFGLPGYGLARYARSHYVFNPSVGMTSNENPASHTDATSGWDGVLPISVTNGTVRDAGVPTIPGGTGACLESGGDAGGTMIPVGGTCSAGSGNAGTACSANDQCTKGTGPAFCETASGQMVTASAVLSISKYLVAPTNHLKFYYTQSCGTEPITGVCTGGANNGTVCTTSTPTGAGAPAGATCTNSPGSFTTSCSSQGQYQAGGSGISLSVSTNGGSLPNTVNGVFQVTKIVSNTAAGDSSSQVKVKMNPTTKSATNCTPYVGASQCSQALAGTGTGTVSTGSSQ